MKLDTNYLGLTLKNPLVPSASPLSKDLDMARRLEDAGAAALVMYSLFEEEILEEEKHLTTLMDWQDLGHGEADSYLPVSPLYRTKLEEYLEQLEALKRSLQIPVVASLNGISDSGWVVHAKELAEAGADALELNLYQVAVDPAVDGAVLEARQLKILEQVLESVSIPVVVKLSPFYSSLGNYIQRLEQAGAAGVSLFNRFYQPDLDLEAMRLLPVLHLSQPPEALMRMHWMALLYGRTGLTLAATGGIHSSTEVIKMLLAGADVTHLCSALLQQGPQLLSRILEELEHWLEQGEYESLDQLRGSYSYWNAPDAGLYERLNYLEMLRRPQVAVRD
jgi:dihydroorotate dehydrogenase (fumarate)